MRPPALLTAPRPSSRAPGAFLRAPGSLLAAPAPLLARRPPHGALRGRGGASRPGVPLEGGSFYKKTPHKTAPYNSERLLLGSSSSPSPSRLRGLRAQNRSGAGEGERDCRLNLWWNGIIKGWCPPHTRWDGSLLLGPQCVWVFSAFVFFCLHSEKRGEAFRRHSEAAAVTLRAGRPALSVGHSEQGLQRVFLPTSWLSVPKS